MVDGVIKLESISDNLFLVENDPTLVQFVERMDVAVCGMFEQCGEFTPTYHVCVGNVFAMLSAPPLEKDLATLLMRSLLAKLGATRVVFVSEAWTLAGTVEKIEPHVDSGESLEHAPGRREVLIYLAEDAMEGQKMAEREITRDAEGRPTLGPLTWRDGMDTMSGRMSGLLPTKGRAN